MNILKVQQSPSPFYEHKITTVTMEQDGNICRIEIEHNNKRQISKWIIINQDCCDLKFTNEQIILLLHKSLDLNKKEPYSYVKVTEEDREKFQRVINCVLKRLHFHYSNDQKFHCDVRSSNELYQEMSYILTS